MKNTRTVLDGLGQSEAAEAAVAEARKRKRTMTKSIGVVELFLFLFLISAGAAAVRGGHDLVAADIVVTESSNKSASLSLVHALSEGGCRRGPREKGGKRNAKEKCAFECFLRRFLSLFFTFRSVPRAFSLSPAPSMAPPSAAGAIASSPSSAGSTLSSSRNANTRSGGKRAPAHPSIISSLESLPFPFLLVTALVASALAPVASRSLARLARLLRRTVDWVLEEFEPWLKWVVLDACLALCVGAVAKRVKAARPALRAIGWL
jgi:hypothetical protein